MTPNEVRATAERLVDYQERFAPHFGLLLEKVGRISRVRAW
jgi:hypothetical protein